MTDKQIKLKIAKVKNIIIQINKIKNILNINRTCSIYIYNRKSCIKYINNNNKMFLSDNLKLYYHELFKSSNLLFTNYLKWCCS